MNSPIRRVFRVLTLSLVGLALCACHFHGHGHRGHCFDWTPNFCVNTHRHCR